MIRTLLAGCLLLGTAASAHAAPLRVLWAMASNQGLAHEPALEFAETDAQAFADVLIAQGQIDPGYVWVRTGLEAADLETTVQQIEARLRAQPNRDITLFFYYSGHGDQDSLHVMGRRIALAKIEAILAGMPADLRIAVVDACRTQTDVAQKGGLRRVPAFDIKVSRPSNLTGVVTLKSSSDGEASQESQSLRGAVFTHFLLTALRGAADHDQDRQVTLDEAYRYAYRQTVLRSAATTGTVMHPSVKMDLEGAGDLVLTQTRPATARFVIPPEQDAQYLVFARPSGTVFAEIWSDSNREVEVRMPPGDYMVHRRAEQGSGAYTFSVEPAEVERVAQSKLISVPRVVLAQKGGRYQLVRHQLAVGAAGVLSQAASFGPRARLRYIYEYGPWAGSGSLAWGRTQYDGKSNQITENNYGADLRFGRAWGPIMINFGATARVVDQRVLRLDASFLSGTNYQVEQSILGFVAGPTLNLGYRKDLFDRVWFGAEIQGTAFVGREDSRWTVRPEAAVEIALGFRL